MFVKQWISGVVMVMGLLVLAGCTTVVAQPAPEMAPEAITIEVAEDINRFSMVTDQVDDTGMPTESTPFSTKGYIYPAGTISGSNGVMADGSPEFPEEVLGEWICFGWILPDGEGGFQVVSTQVFTFEGAYGNGMITTQGFEPMEVGVPTERIVSGGTGDFAHINGQIQTLMGMTDQMAVNLGITFEQR